MSYRLARISPCAIPSHLCLKLAGAPRVGGNTGLESVLESAGDTLEESHAASTGSLSALSLLAPVVCPYPSAIMFRLRGLSLSSI